MSRTFLKTALMTGILAGFLGSAQAQNLEQFAGVQPSVLHDFRVVTVADGLEVPWSMAWLPNGDMLVTEAKAGRLRVIRDGVLQPEAISGVPEVFNMGQGGLFDVLPHPDFESNQLVYLSYSKPLGGRDSTTTVIRGRLANGALNDVEEIFVANARGASHFGGRMAFDADGYLFVTLGDRQAPPSGDLEKHPAQDLSNHHGVIVRLNDDGTVPSDNPFVGQSGAEPAIYSYGHRSPQGLAIHPETGVMLMTEHGPQGGDELNIVEPGNNYGWPVVGRGVNYGAGAPIHQTISQEGMENPIHFWVPSIAASGLAIYTGSRFPMWHGSVFAGGMAGEQLARLTLSEDGSKVITEETLLPGIGRVRDVRQGPDGLLYIAIEDRSRQPTAILRLEPAQ
jgi:aldose sugar dehydrogenase